MKRNRRPTAPGTILKKFYLEARSLSIAQFADAVGMSRKHISNIVNDKASITPDAAFRFSAVLDTTPAYWLNLQNAVDLYDAQERLKNWKPKEIHPACVMAI